MLSENIATSLGHQPAWRVRDEVKSRLGNVNDAAADSLRNSPDAPTLLARSWPNVRIPHLMLRHCKAMIIHIEHLQFG